MTYETAFLISLFLTLVIEIAVVLALTRYVFKTKKGPADVVFAGFIASFATLPYLWFVMPPFIDQSYYVPLGETLVTLFEALVYNRLLELRPSKAFLLSVAANVVSFAIGLLIAPLIFA